MNLLTMLGYACELAGLGVAFYGLHRTFTEYAPGETELDPVLNWLRSLARRMGRYVRHALGRLLGRPVGPERHSGSLTSSLTFSSSIRARKTYGYPQNKTVKAVVETLQARTQELLTRTDDLSDKIADEVDARGKGDDALTARIDAQDSRIDEVARQIVVGGLRLQLVGLFLVTIGLALQGFGQALGR